MGYERNPRDRNRDEDMDYGRDFGSGRDYTYSSARDFASAGWRGDRDDNRYDQDRGYGGGGDNRRYDQRAGGGQGGRSYGERSYNEGGYQRDFSGGHGAGYGSGRYSQNEAGPGPSAGYRQSWGRGLGYRDESSSDQRSQYQGGGYQGGRDRPDRPPSDYSYEDRGFFSRAGDEVRSWFGDEDAERRRNFDQRYDERYGASTDRDYDDWRRGQINSLDRDYDEYRRENQSKFHSEFNNWRTQRQTQRSSLDQVNEHMEVVGSDGQHVGTVDKVRGDRIILTKADKDAGGHHHSIPSKWIQTVDDKVTISKTADEAKREWKDEERRSALFSDDDRTDSGPHNLNRSFSGTYRS